MIDPKVFKQVRKALGLSQQELADALGLSRVTVNKMERGRLRRGIPDEVADRLLALRRYEATPDFLKPLLTGKLQSWNPIGNETGPDADCAPTPVNDAHLWDNEEDDQ